MWRIAELRILAIFWAEALNDGNGAPNAASGLGITRINKFRKSAENFASGSTYFARCGQSIFAKIGPVSRVLGHQSLATLCLDALAVTVFVPRVTCWILSLPLSCQPEQW